MSDASAAGIEKAYVERTGSDDFDVPAVAAAVRKGAGFTTATPEELVAVGDRSIDASESLTDEEKAAAKRKIRAALGVDVVESAA